MTFPLHLVPSAAAAVPRQADPAVVLLLSAAPGPGLGPAPGLVLALEPAPVVAAVAAFAAAIAHAAPHGATRPTRDSLQSEAPFLSCPDSVTTRYCLGTGGA